MSLQNNAYAAHNGHMQETPPSMPSACSLCEDKCRISKVDLQLSDALSRSEQDAVGMAVGEEQLISGHPCREPAVYGWCGSQSMPAVRHHDPSWTLLSAWCSNRISHVAHRFHLAFGCVVADIDVCQACCADTASWHPAICAWPSRLRSSLMGRGLKGPEMVTYAAVMLTFR